MRVHFGNGKPGGDQVILDSDVVIADIYSANGSQFASGAQEFSIALDKALRELVVLLASHPETNGVMDVDGFKLKVELVQ